jgi:predicted dienelactone hydrolase
MEVGPMVAVRRGLGAALVAGVVLVGLLVNATAYLAGFTAPAPGAPRVDHGLSHARPGPHAVGVRRPAPGGSAPALTVWYPAAEVPPGGRRLTHSYALTFLGAGSTTALATSAGRAHLGAAPDPAGPYPLVVLSSGFAITAGSYAWLAEHLASYGMVVVAPEHEESLDPRNLWQATLDRPDVVGRTRAAVAAMARPGGDLAGLVDEGTTAVVGHSYGGYTALAAGGARIDPGAFEAACRGARVVDDPVTFLCDALLPHLEAVAAGTLRPGGSGEASGPAAVDAVVSLEGDAAMFGTAGLAEIDAPLLVVGGTADHDSPFDWSSRLAYDSVSSPRKAEVALDGAGHFVFTGACQSVRRLLTVVPTGFCSDPGWDRERARAVTRHYVAAFLVAELAGEPTAAAALSTTASPVEDVRYRAAGY